MNTDILISKISTEKGAYYLACITTAYWLYSDKLNEFWCYLVFKMSMPCIFLLLHVHKILFNILVDFMV